MPAKSHANIVEKLIHAVRNDPKKAGILTVLVVILGTLQVRLLMKKEGGPASAVAASSAATSDNDPSHSTGNKPMDPATALRAWMDTPSEQLTRNLFSVNLEYFPSDANRPALISASDSQGFWDDLAKSMSARADVRRERQVLHENLQQQVSRMHLQSTMMGAKPKAVINGELVREGDVVATFRVLKIEARRVIIEREGIKLEILMK